MLPGSTEGQEKVENSGKAWHNGLIPGSFPVGNSGKPFMQAPGMWETAAGGRKNRNLSTSASVCQDSGFIV